MKNGMTMMKNMEWGAVAYLTSSKYGRYTDSSTCVSGGCEIWINLNFDHITGCAGSSVSDSSSSTCNAWTTTNGKHASTTDNQYGIYDMSGGSWDFVMGNISSSSSSYVYNASSLGLNQPLTRYMDKYINSTNQYTEASVGKLGDSTIEVIANIGSSMNAWNSDMGQFAVSENPWILRGGTYTYDVRAGIFAFGYRNGSKFMDGDSFRAVLSAQDGNYNGNGLS